MISFKLTVSDYFLLTHVPSNFNEETVIFFMFRTLPKVQWIINVKNILKIPSFLVLTILKQAGTESGNVLVTFPALSLPFWEVSSKRVSCHSLLLGVRQPASPGSDCLPQLSVDWWVFCLRLAMRITVFSPANYNTWSSIHWDTAKLLCSITLLSKIWTIYWSLLLHCLLYTSRCV